MLHFVLLASISFVQHFHVTYMDGQGLWLLQPLMEMVGMAF